MKQPYSIYRLLVLGTGALTLGLATGCGNSSTPKPKPSTAKLAIRRLQSDGNNTMAYVQVKLLNSNTPYQLVLGGNTDTYNGVPETTPDATFPTGEYKFRVWYPEVVLNPPYPYNPPLRGKTQAELLVNGQVKATINLDAFRPTFERDTCSRTLTVKVE